MVRPTYFLMSEGKYKVLIFSFDFPPFGRHVLKTSETNLRFTLRFSFFLGSGPGPGRARNGRWISCGDSFAGGRENVSVLTSFVFLHLPHKRVTSIEELVPLLKKKRTVLYSSPYYSVLRRR